MISDDFSQRLQELHEYERTRGNRGISLEAYRRNAEILLADDSCFEFVFNFDKHSLDLTLLSNDGNGFVDANAVQEKWSLYVDRFVQSDNIDLNLMSHVKVPVYLK
eukprot:Awhi_evm1s15175